VKLLLDTHVALWAVTDNPKLSQTAKSHILSPSNEVFVSAATVWEVAIKHRLNRENMPCSGAAARRFFIEAGYQLLPITDQHAVATEDLPMIHADPFDRIIIAQALSESLTLLTHDAIVATYSDGILFV
jgi:PIN domain nuclease of toxin-antitoxin system